jgi:hypothetical protein
LIVSLFARQLRSLEPLIKGHISFLLDKLHDQLKGKGQSATVKS